MLLLVLLLGSCSAESAPLVLASYNVENLFDAVYDGSEYQDFIPSEGWSSRNYSARKAEIVTVLQGISPAPDIIFLQEVENDRVVEQLQRDLRWYRWRASTDNPDTATEVALLSKYPLQSVYSHRPHDAKTSLRFILEVEIRIEGTSLFLFVNHWKSKRGGAETTEVLRIRSAELLKERMDMRSMQGAVIAGGDFNEEPWESALHDYPTALSDAHEGVINTTAPSSMSAYAFASPWYDVREGGSYRFQNQWRAIDGFLLSQRLLDLWSVDSFFVWQETQASDHLPVVLVLSPVLDEIFMTHRVK